MSKLLDQFGKPLRSPDSHYKAIGGSETVRARITKDDPNRIGSYASLSPLTGYKRAEELVDWKWTFLNEEELVGKSAGDLAQILLHSSPDLSRARSNLIMFVNKGFTLTTAENNDQAQAVLDAALQQMEDMKSPLSVKIDQSISSMFMKGGILTENIFDGTTNGGLRFVDIAVTDPFTLAIRENEDEERGQFKELGQVQGGQFVLLSDRPNVQYRPVHGTESSIIGVPMISSVIFPIIFLMGMMRTARQALQAQAQPNGLVTIDGEKVIASGTAPEDLEDTIDGIVKGVEEDFNNALPNEIFVRGAEVAYQVMGATKANFDMLPILEEMVRRQIVKGLKQFPIIDGIDEGTALSTSSGTQLESFIQFIESLQSDIENHYEIHFRQILENAGITDVTPILRLDRSNAIIQEHRAKVLQLKVDSYIKLMEAGIIDRQEARNLVRNSEALNDLAAALPESDVPDLEEVPEEESTDDNNTDSEQEETEEE